MFHYFTLEEVYEYAERMGYAREDVEIERVCVEYDWNQMKEVAWDYEVSFGHEGTEVWVWTFEDLEGVSVDYEHGVWED